MGIQLNGTSGTDVISAVDGSLTVEGLTVSVGDLSLGNVTARQRLHIHTGDSGASNLVFTNTTTGTAASDGFVIGITGAEDGQIWHQESANIKFGTADTEKLRITSGGSIGINTTNPQAKLQVNATAVPNIAEFYRKDGDTNDQARICLGALSTNIPSQRGITLVAENNGAGHDFIVNTSPSHSLGPTEKLRVTSGGAVIIGDTTTGKAFAGGDSFIIGNTTSGTRTGMTLVSHSGQDGGIYFSRGTSSNSDYVKGQIVYDHTGDFLKFYTAGAASFSIDSVGNMVTGNQTSPLSSDVGNIYIKNASAIGSVGTNWNVASNARFDSAWKYNTSATAKLLCFTPSNVNLNTAPSGTAGNTIAFVETLRIEDSGDIHFGNRSGNSNTSHWAKARVNICGPQPIPTAFTQAGSYIHVGGNESTAGGVYPISFGHIKDTYTYAPGWFGAVTSNSAAAEAIDFVWHTRTSTSDAIPTEKVRITAAGYMSTSQPYGYIRYGQTGGVADSAAHQCTSQSSKVERNGMSIAANNRMTVPIAGFYLITVMGNVSKSNGTTHRPRMDIKKNGSYLNRKEHQDLNGWHSFGFAHAVEMAANDYIDVWITGKCDSNDFQNASIVLIG